MIRSRVAVRAAVLAIVVLAAAACGTESRAGEATGTPAQSVSPPLGTTSNGTPPSTAAASGSTTLATPAPGKRWAGRKQFMQIKDAERRGDAVYLRLRPAKQEFLGESFETVTLGGPYTEVAMTAGGRVLVLVPGNLKPGKKPITQNEFMIRLSKLPTEQRDEGFDVTFDGQGRVKLVEWLFVP